MSLADWENFERRHLVLTGFRALVTSAVVLVAYFELPLSRHPHGSIALRLFAGLALFMATLGYEVRAIMRSNRPVLRAADAMALVIPTFLVVFAWTYLTMAVSDPASFTEPMTRVSSLYFTVTVFSTVGFGDITPLTDQARLAVTIQMVSDLIFLAVVIRLILGAVRVSSTEPSSSVRDDLG